MSEGTATVDASDSSGPSVGVCSPSSTSSVSSVGSSTACSRDGRARPSSSASTGARRLRLRPPARGGKGPGAESQGRGGKKGLYEVGEGGAACTDFSAAGGGVSMVVFVGGVEAESCVCEWAEGVEGAGWGVWMRWTGGVRECTMGGVWPMARFTGGMAAM